MDLFTQMVEELKVSRYPIILYGAGYLASEIREFLEKNSISITGYAVDDKYMSGNRQYEGKPVYSLEKYTCQNDCNIIFAFSFCSERMEEELRNKEHIKKLYVLDFPGRFVLREENMMSEEFYRLHKPTLDKLRNDLCDEESKLQLDEFISQKRVGNYRKRFSHNTTYFDKDIISLSENEVYVDCGAYDGDTILSFIDNLKSDVTNICIYAFEADSSNVDKMKINLCGLKNVEIISKGVYDYTGTLFFSNEGTDGSHIDDNGEKIEVTTIDEVVRDSNVTFIKMDIEGSELKALKGAKKTIKRCRPKLAICVYHKVDDLITIPQYIQNLNPDYRLFFRNYHANAFEAVIYAI